MSEVVFPRTLVNQILEQAQRAGDREVCGLVSAASGRPAHAYPVRNVADDPAHHFRMDPQEQIDAMRQMRARDEELFAIYHSHPDAPACPSAEDLREAAYPEALYIIVSLATEGTLEMRGFRLRDDDVEEFDIVVE